MLHLNQKYKNVTEEMSSYQRLFLNHRMQKYSPPDHIQNNW